MTIKVYTPNPVKRWFHRNRWIIVSVVTIVTLAVVLRVFTSLNTAGTV